MKKLTDDPILFRDITLPLESVRVVIQNGAIIESKVIYDVDTLFYHGTVRDLLKRALLRKGAGIDMKNPTEVQSLVGRASFTIAGMTRQGDGNVVVVSENSLFDLSLVDIEILVSDALNDNEIAIMHRAENFAGPFVAEIKGDKVDAILSERRPNILGYHRDYGMLYEVDQVGT